MTQTFLLVARQVAILSILIGIGAACRRFRLVDDFAARGLVNVLLLLVTPALVVTSFQRPFDPALLRQLGLAFVVTFAAHFAFILLAHALARGTPRTLPVLRMSMAFSNAGFMGMPLQHALLGADGVFYGIVYVAVFNILFWSYGVFQMRGPAADGRRFEPKILLNPGTLSLAAGLPLFLTSTTLPETLGRPVQMLSDLNTPLGMLVVGYYLAGSDLRAILRLPSAFTAAFMRLVAFPLLLIGALYLWRGTFDRTMAVALATSAAAPTAAMVTMFASKFDRDVDLAVGLVSGTTLLSLVTLPALVTLALVLCSA